MGNFESYTYKITSTPETTQNQKPVALRAIHKGSDPDFVCPVVTYNDGYTDQTTNHYICVAYTLDFNQTSDQSQAYSADGEFSTLLTPDTAANFDIEAGTKSGRYCWMNCMTSYDYNGGSPRLTSLATRLSAIDVDQVVSAPPPYYTVETAATSPTGFTNITTNTYMFTSMWQNGIFFAALAGETSLVNPSAKSGPYSTAKIPDTFGTMALGSSTVTGWLGVNTGTAGQAAELTITRSGTNPREVIANFEEVLVIDNSPTAPSLTFNRITGNATTPSITNNSYSISGITGSYIKMLAVFQHNATVVIVAQTGSLAATFDLLVVDISTAQPTLTHQMNIDSISADVNIARGDIRMVYIGGHHTDPANQREEGTAVGIVVDDVTSMRLYVCDWVLGGSGTLSAARPLSGVAVDIEQVECAGVQQEGTDLSYVMMYRDTGTTIEFDYVNAALDTWSNVGTYTSLNTNFSWAKSYEEQEFITMSEVYSTTQDFVIHRYSFGTAGDGFPVYIS